MNEKDVVVIGDEATVTGFRLAGITRFYKHSPELPAEKENLEKKLRELIADNTVGMIIINERLLDSLDRKFRRKIDDITTPVIVAVPDRTGPVEDTESLRNLITRALGFDMMRR
ncbi:MAG: V-type ATP synthase subunit F [Candidatus Micrarchaeia archaeon]